MSMFYIGSRYNSKYGKEALRSINSYNSTAPCNTKTDTYSSKFEQAKKNNNSKSVLTTIALMAVSAFAAYKGKNAIQKVIKGCSSATGKTASKVSKGFSKVCPNLSESIKYFGKACKSPVNGVKKLASGIVNLFKKTK